MLKTIFRYLARFYTWYYIQRLKSKGERQTTVTMEPIEGAMVVLVTAIYGYRLTFTCRKIEYVFTYAKSASKDTHFVYKLYASTEDELPDRLREVLKHEIYLPRLFSYWIDEETNRTIMLSIFIAVLKEKFHSCLV